MDHKDNIEHRTSPYNWLLLLQFSAFFLALGLLFNESTAPLLTRWLKWDEDLSHAIPTVLASLFLIFRIKTFPYSADSKTIRTTLIITILLLSVAWLLFVLANITLFANFVLFICIPIVVAACYSVRTTIFFAPALGLLFFTLPIFSQLNNILVLMSAKIVGFLVPLVGMTALIDGQNIFIPYGHIFIADGCSGLRYLTISILLGYLLSILNNYNLGRFIFTLAVATFLGLATNWLRIFLLVVIGDVTQMKSSLMHDHELFGWVLFSCIMLPAIYFSPFRPAKLVETTARPHMKPLLPLIALVLGPLIFNLIPNHADGADRLSLESASLTPQLKPTDNLLPSKLPTTPYTEYATKTDKGADLHIQLTQYRPEKLREKIIPYFDFLYNKEEWQNISQNTSDSLKSLGYKVIKLRRTGTQLHALQIYRYEIGTKNTNNYEIAKILQIPATFAGKRYFNIFSVHSLCSEETCENELTAATQIALDWNQSTHHLR